MPSKIVSEFNTQIELRRRILFRVLEDNGVLSDRDNAYGDVGERYEAKWNGVDRYLVRKPYQGGAYLYALLSPSSVTRIGRLAY